MRPVLLGILLGCPKSPPAHVPLDTTLATEVSVEGWSQRTEAEWLVIATTLHQQLDRIRANGIVSADALQIAIAAGRAGENTNLPEPPFFDEVRPGLVVNVGYYEAARMVRRNRGLLDSLHDQQTWQQVNHLAGQLTDADD